MKALLITVTIFIGSFCFAQENTSGNVTFKGKTVTTDSEKCIMQYTGNSSFKDDKLTITNADKIIYDISSKEITVTGGFSYSFAGDINMSSPFNDKTFTYKLGDGVAYIK